MTGFIYIITNNINNKQYIGQTIQTLKKRFDRHCQFYGSESESRMAIKQAIHKYGRKNFSIKMLEECAIEELNEREIYYISLYNTYFNGYNSTKGGQLGKKELKLSQEEQQEVKDLYQLGFSLRAIAEEYGVDKTTIKHILELSNISIRTTRTYKLSQQDRCNILEDLAKGLSRKEIMNKYHISKSYLSQMINGSRRI